IGWRMAAPVLRECPSDPIVRPGLHVHPDLPSSPVLSYQSRAAMQIRAAWRSSFVILRKTAERIAQRNHNGLATRTCKRHLQVSAVLNLARKFAVLIAHRMRHMTPQIRKRDVHVLPGNSRIAQVQELAGNQQIAAPGLRFNLQVNLKWVRAIEHLPGIDSRRPGPCGSGLQKAVEEDRDAAPGFLSLATQPRGRKSCLSDPQGRGRRLITRFRRRELLYALPQRNRFPAAFAPLFQVVSHFLPTPGRNRLIYKIDPLLRCKVLHGSPHVLSVPRPLPSSWGSLANTRCIRAQKCSKNT